MLRTETTFLKLRQYCRLQLAPSRIGASFCILISGALTPRFLKISVVDASVQWHRLPASAARQSSNAGLRWPSSRLGAQLHGMFDQQGHPVFMLLGGHSSFTHQELWIGNLDPLGLNCYEPKAQNMFLWGHTSCFKPDVQQLWVFGGRGPHGELSNSVHCASIWPRPKFDEISAQHAPLPRYRHAAALDGNLMVVFGGVVHLGSTFKKKKYDSSIAVFDTQSLMWHSPVVAPGPKPSSRCDHTLTRVREGVFLMMFGCLEDDDSACNELWELSSGSVWSWRQICCTGVPMGGVFSHSAVCWNDCVVVFGGMRAAKHGKNLSLCDDLTVIDTTTWHHHAVSSQSPPSSRCGHGCVLYGNTMVRLARFDVAIFLLSVVCECVNASSIF